MYANKSSLSSYSTFFDYKTIYIKLLNGDLFSVEINDFDDPSTLIDKIIEHNKDNESYRLRKHRMNFFIEKENKENIIPRNISEINISSLEDEDVLCILCDPIKDRKSIFPHQFFNLKDENDKCYLVCNHFVIKSLETLYDEIDNIYFNNYDHSIPMFFEIELKDYTVSLTETLENLLEMIPFQDESKKILIKIKDNFFTELLINYFKKISYISVNTLGLETVFVYKNSIDLLSILNDKSSYIQNLYLNSHWFEFEGFTNNKNNIINLGNVPNIYVFQTINRYRYNANSVDYFLLKIQSLNNTIYIKNLENRNYSKSSRDTGWMNIGSDPIDNNINIYKNVSNIKEGDDFFSFFSLANLGIIGNISDVYISEFK